ncbi:MAG: hypothetical protein GY751_21540 [Bacteroidetes bacterium]|nr:hypothetical protein [Bacteroidota bacterium]
MDEITISIKPEDAELLLNVINQVNCQGKEGAIQLLRIIHALENVIKDGEISEEKF